MDKPVETMSEDDTTGVADCVRAVDSTVSLEDGALVDISMAGSWLVMVGTTDGERSSSCCVEREATMLTSAAVVLGEGRIVMGEGVNVLISGGSENVPVLPSNSSVREGVGERRREEGRFGSNIKILDEVASGVARGKLVEGSESLLPGTLLADWLVVIKRSLRLVVTAGVAVVKNGESVTSVSATTRTFEDVSPTAGRSNEGDKATGERVERWVSNELKRDGVRTKDGKGKEVNRSVSCEGEIRRDVGVMESSRADRRMVCNGGRSVVGVEETGKTEEVVESRTVPDSLEDKGMSKGGMMDVVTGEGKMVVVRDGMLGVPGCSSVGEGEGK